MSSAIHIKLAARNVIHINRSGDKLAFAINRRRQKLPHRRDDHAAAIDQHGFRRVPLQSIIVYAIGDIGAGHILTG